MYASLVAVALSAFFAPAVTSEKPLWLKDYGKARQQGRKAHKPVCVVIGSGRSGWGDLSEEAKFGNEVNRLLAAHYVCLYVDTEHISGQRLAEAFDIAADPGIVISDATGKLQAFRHEGQLSNSSLAGYLRRFADPERVVETTETNPGSGRGYYSREQAVAPAAPVTLYSSFGGGGGC